MSHENLTHCPNCGSQWIGEERKLQECYDCGYPDQDQPLPKQKAAPLEWDTDDDEAMPNLIL